MIEERIEEIYHETKAEGYLSYFTNRNHDVRSFTLYLYGARKSRNNAVILPIAPIINQVSIYFVSIYANVWQIFLISKKINFY